MSIPVENVPSGIRVSRLIPISRIMPNPGQPRREFDEYKLLELASSIRQHGLLQPVTVTVQGNFFELIMGERRLRACKMLGFTHIEAFVIDSTVYDREVLALVENIQRENLHFLEEAQAYARLLQEGFTQETLASHLGKSVSCIANKIRLLGLSQEVREVILWGNLTERHARALLRLPEGKLRLEIAHEAAENHWTVRETEAKIGKEIRKLPASVPKRKIISLAYDPRLYVNAIRSVVEQMNSSGMMADMQIEERNNSLEVRIVMPRK